MKSVLAALVIVFLAGSAAMGQCYYVASPVAVMPPPAMVVPAPMPVTTYYAAPPVYSYPAPVWVSPGPVYYPGRAVVRYYPYGQPVRNVVRFALPPY